MNKSKPNRYSFTFRLHSEAQKLALELSQDIQKAYKEMEVSKSSVHFILKLSSLFTNVQ